VTLACLEQIAGDGKILLHWTLRAYDATVSLVLPDAIGGKRIVAGFRLDYEGSHLPSLIHRSA